MTKPSRDASDQPHRPRASWMDRQARVLTLLLLAVAAGCSHGPGLAGAERSMKLMHAKLSITIARGDQSDWATP
jgi:hypothetical protein